MLVRNADPVLRSAFREMLVVLTLWIVAGCWSVGYCYLFGYLPAEGDAGGAAREIRFILGFPAWVFWGVVVPWVLCSVASLFISVFVMTDGDLGVDPGEEDLDDA